MRMVVQRNQLEAQNMRLAAIYARVSSDRQKEEHTIDSQISALKQYAHSEAFTVPEEWIFQDEGYSGATLIRPGLERLRDLASEGQIETVLVYSPDRLSRKYAYQVLLMEEFARHGVETVFVKAPQGHSAEDQLLVQFQGMIADDAESVFMQSHTAKVTASPALWRCGAPHYPVSKSDAISAKVFVPKASHHLKVALKPGYHEYLLKKLRGLRKRKELPRVHAARNQIIARALRRTFRKHRSLYLKKPL